MIYKYTYKTPENFSNIIMNSDGEYLTGLWFEGSRDSSKHIIDCEERNLEIFKERCKWCNLKNKKYIEYHDKEWGIPIYDDKHLYEMIILESFQAGLSWECVLNKREDFRKAFDNFEIDKICDYDEKKIQELLKNENIIRNKLKINSAINNSKIFKKIQNEHKTFSNYIWHFTDNKVIYEIGKTRSELSDKISKDLQKRGMKFVGTKIIYSYLQAIGVIYSHDKECFMYKSEKI